MIKIKMKYKYIKWMKKKDIVFDREEERLCDKAKLRGQGL